VKTLEELSEALGADRKITICRELTKRYEEAYRATFEEALARFEAEDPKGECVIVIEGRSIESLQKEQQQSWEEMTIEEHMEYYENQGIDGKEAMKLVAKDRGISKRDVYQYLHT
jgi:16S rRNA (cytidine1402-2'-O)-methyltransferase